MLNTNQQCGHLILSGELVPGFDYEPRCMVLVVSSEHEKGLFDEMIAAGRDLSEKIRISVNFTVATGATPDVKLASTSCHNGHVLERNYMLDRTGQDQLDELESVRNSVVVYTELIEFTKHVRDSESLMAFDPVTGRATRLPESPKPPPPPPPTPGGPDGSPAPPAPPELVSLDRQVAIYEAEKLALEEREIFLVETLTSCTVGDRVEDVVCGMTSNEANTLPTHAQSTPPLSLSCCLIGCSHTEHMCFRHRIHGWRSTVCAAAATPRARRVCVTTADIGASFANRTDDPNPSL